MKKIVKWILLAIILVGGVAGGVYYALQPLSAEAVSIMPREASLYFIEEGYVKGDTMVNVYAMAAGKLLSVNAVEGQTVKRGDILCVVDGSDYEYQIQQIESNIQAANAQMKNLDTEERRQKDNLIYNKEQLQNEHNGLTAQQATADRLDQTADVAISEQLRLQEILVEQSRRDLATAQENLAKAQVLCENGLMSANDYEALQNLVTAAESALSGNEQQLSVIQSGKSTPQTSDDYYNSMKGAIEAQIRSIDNSLNKSYTGAMKDYYAAQIAGSQSNIAMLKDKIAECTIITPVDGEITNLGIEHTNIVSPQTPIAVIKSEITDDIEVYVSTKDIQSVAVGDNVELSVTRQGKDVTFPGAVTEIDHEATMKLSALGVEERRVKVTIRPQTPSDILLRAGFDVDVKFITYRAKDQLTVPKTAVFKNTDTGQELVWRIVDGKAVRTPVVTGIALRTDFVIDQGLSSGDVVIRDADLSGLAEGANVRSE